MTAANGGSYGPANTYDYDPPSKSRAYEEYHPYGTTAYRAADSQTEVSAKRYRYTGKEKDEETGLYYHGARYYACWLGRWTAADPAGLGDGNNRFKYVGNNPVNYQDSGGTKKEPSKLGQLIIGIGQKAVEYTTGDPDLAEKVADVASEATAKETKPPPTKERQVEPVSARSGEDRRGQYRAQQASRTTSQRAGDAYSSVAQKGVVAPLHTVGTGLGENAGAVGVEVGDIVQAGREGRLGAELYKKGSEVVAGVLGDVGTAVGTYKDVPEKLGAGDFEGATERYSEGAGAAWRTAAVVATALEGGALLRTRLRGRSKGTAVATEAEASRVGEAEAVGPGAATAGGGGPVAGSLDNVAAREWYHAQLEQIPGRLDQSLPLRERALQAFEMRNEIKLQARDLMADRAAAEALPAPRTLADVVKRAYDSGARGNDVWRYVLRGSGKSNPKVDAALGL